MTRISLEPDQVELLQAVDDGLVERHRRGQPLKRAGDDYQRCPDNGLRPRRRRASARIKVLCKLRLVELPAGDPDHPVWKWRLTPRGRAVLAYARGQAEDAEATP